MLYKLIILLLFLFNPTDIEYDIVEIYKGLIPEEGTVVLTPFNEVKEAELILIPVKIDPGNYSVKVTRKAKDLYSVDGFNIIIKTRFCTENSFNSPVQIKISSFEGRYMGKIIFPEEGY